MGESGTIGLDFGTSTTLIAERVAWGVSTVVPLGHTATGLPSVAHLDAAGIVVGEPAEERGPLPIRSVKRSITDRRDCLTVLGPAGPQEVKVDTVIEAIIAEALGRAARAGVAIGDGHQVRLGCPAMWDGAQRRRLIEIAGRSGLSASDLPLIDEPVAAGAAWLLDRYLRHGDEPAGRLLVFDMGGGTLDVAVLDVIGGPQPEVFVRACMGAPLAGDALDLAIARDLASVVDISRHGHPDLAWELLTRAGREAKVRLSAALDHPIVLPRQLHHTGTIRYSRDRLDDAFSGQMDGAENLVYAALRTARLTRPGVTSAQIRAADRRGLAEDIDFVLLAGGMSRVPYVARRLGRLLPKAQVYGNAGVAPDEAVVAGLAGIGALSRLTLNRPPYDIVVAWDNGRVSAYDAYTPLFEPWEVYNGLHELGYERRLRPPDVPGSGHGWLRVLDSSGQVVPLDINGETVQGLPIAFGPQDVMLVIGCDGLVTLTDGLGRVTQVRASGWVVPFAGKASALTLTQALRSN
jgi:molecular chaperone DnaK (HSP70)